MAVLISNPFRVDEMPHLLLNVDRVMSWQRLKGNLLDKMVLDKMES
jgi:hypothetical protein